VPCYTFYDSLQNVLTQAAGDAFVETICKPFYASSMGAL
jgi:hypothetical protein